MVEGERRRCVPDDGDTHGGRADDLTDRTAARRRGGGCWRSGSPPRCSPSSSWWCCASATTGRRAPSPSPWSSPLLAGAAVVVTWLESRRITRHLNRTIERLIDTESELRLLLDDLPEAVVSLDDGGVVRGANAKAAELTGRPVSALAGRPFAELVEPARGTDLDGVAGDRALRAPGRRR